MHDVNPAFYRQLPKSSAPLVVQSKDSNFSVADPQGVRIMDAQVGRMEGEVQAQSGLQGPIKMHKAKCLLYEKGQPSINLVSDEAVWDGKQLTTSSPAHGVTADKDTIIDAARAVWTSENAHLNLEQATLQQMRQGKPDFTAQGPKALVVQRVVTMDSGGKARNPAGQQLTADHMRWHMQTGQVQAHGNVVVTDEDTRVAGQHLDADTKLKRGRMTGATRTVLKQKATERTAKKPGRKNR